MFELTVFELTFTFTLCSLNPPLHHTPTPGAPCVLILSVLCRPVRMYLTCTPCHIRRTTLRTCIPLTPTLYPRAHLVPPHCAPPPPFMLQLRNPPCGPGSHFEPPIPTSYPCCTHTYLVPLVLGARVALGAAVERHLGSLDHARRVRLQRDTRRVCRATCVRVSEVYVRNL